MRFEKIRNTEPVVNTLDDAHDVPENGSCAELARQPAGIETETSALLETPQRKQRVSRHLKISDIDRTRLAAARQSFATRRVDLGAVAKLIEGPIRPRSGDLVLVRVDRVRYHRRIELVNGRKANLFPGDEIVLAYGDRYATEMYEGLVPNDLGPTNLIATGGVAATMVSRRSGMRSATEITPIGLLGNDRGDPVNLRDFALDAAPPETGRPQTIAVLGTAMNSGKTTTCKALIRGLRDAGKRVAGLKITGTGSGGDYWGMCDSGADVCADFTDAGFASTYRLGLGELEQILTDLLAYATAQQVDVAVIEIADGLFQEQNSQLLASPVFRQAIDRVVFAAFDAMGAAQGVATLAEAGLPVVAISGRVTMSALSMREIPKSVPVAILSKQELETAQFAMAEVLEAEVGDAAPVEPGVTRSMKSVFGWSES